jgi:hypothetical protein
MLVRDRMKLDRLRMIPQFMRDAWEKEYGDKYPTEETESMQRWVRFEGAVSWILTKLSFVFLIISGATILPATMGMLEEKELFLSLGRYSLCSAIPLYIVPKLLTRWIQSKTKSNNFNDALGKALEWMRIEPKNLGNYSAKELEGLAEEALIKHAQRIICFEKWTWGISGLGRDNTLETLREETRTKCRVFRDLAIFDKEWGPIFAIAQERFEQGKKETVN